MVRLAWPPEAQENLAGTLDADWFVHHEGDEFRESAWPNERLVDGCTSRHSRIQRHRFRTPEFLPGRQRLARGKVSTAGITWLSTRCPVGQGSDQVLEEDTRCRPRLERRRRSAFREPACGPVRFLLRRYPIRSHAHGEQGLRQAPPALGSRRGRDGWHVQYDDILPGHDFLQPTARLREFDSDQVRMQLPLQPKISRVSWQPDPTTPHDLKAPRCLSQAAHEIVGCSTKHR